MEIIFHSYAVKTYFHKKGCASSLVLKVRVFGTRRWPIANRRRFSRVYRRPLALGYVLYTLLQCFTKCLF